MLDAREMPHEVSRVREVGRLPNALLHASAHHEYELDLCVIMGGLPVFGFEGPNGAPQRAWRDEVLLEDRSRAGHP